MQAAQRKVRPSENEAPTSLEHRQRVVAGWRAGRPVEDPDKTKAWGFVRAKPSEYLVHVRHGRVRERSSGQGASCFKWPSDAVAVVPTSLQQLSFTADQVSAEKTGVVVTGLAVYRIAEPLLAYRVLNFSYPERAQEKLEETLTAMFVGATRRLVANLTVEECLQKRKTALAAELLREVAPVVGGMGAPGDGTSQGWGVVIDTIEIQEVRVASPAVFSAMQAPFRVALERRAREAKVEAEQHIAEAELANEAALAARRAQASRDAATHEAEVALARLEQRRREAAAELATMETLEAAAMRRLTAEQRQAEIARAQRWADAQAETGIRRLEAEVAALEAEAAVRAAQAQAEVLRAQNLPQLAAAVGQRIGEVRVLQMGGDGNPFASITQAVTAVLELASAHRKS